MIRKLRKRFIAIAMLSVVIVLALILGTLVVEDYKLMATKADAILTMLAENDGRFPENLNRPGDMGDPYEDPIVEDDSDNDNSHRVWNDASDLSEETPYNTRYCTIVLNDDDTTGTINTGFIKSVTSSDVRKMALVVKKLGKTSGYIGDFRYMVYDRGDGTTMYLFLNQEDELSSAHNMVVVIFMIFALASLLIFILILLFSKRVFRPVEETYAKQKEFITNAGHELKTPLAIIDSCTEVIEMEQGESKWTSGIHEEVDRLATMTKELVDLSRMDETATDLDKRNLDLSALAETIWQPFALMAEEEGLALNLNVEPNIQLYGNERMLKQLCSILADNAVKYATPGTEIDLTLKKKGRRIHISSYNAADNVTKGSHNELFDRFYRGDTSHNSEKSGYGIGLSMAHSIVESHGGKISAESSDGQHLKITASLPDKVVKRWKKSKDQEAGTAAPTA